MKKSILDPRNFFKGLFLFMVIGLVVTSVYLLRTTNTDNRSQARAQNEKISRLVVFGDSVSVGAGASTRAKSYPELLHQMLENHYGYEIEYLNIAIGGATTEYLAPRQLKLFEDEVTIPADGKHISVVTIGGNNITKGLRNNDDYREVYTKTNQDLNQMARYTQNRYRFPNTAQVYVANLYDPTDGFGIVYGCEDRYGSSERITNITQKFSIWNRLYSNLAQNYSHIQLVDLNSLFENHGFSQTNNTLPSSPVYNEDFWMADCKHPNDYGHAAIAEQMFELIVENN